jgi:hypothetical protein
MPASFVLGRKSASTYHRGYASASLLPAASLAGILTSLFA